MWTKLTIFTMVLVLEGIVAPPVTQKSHAKESEDSDMNKLEDYMEYHRYLKEVVNALESDPDFRNKLEKANEDEIRSGQIADQLEFVSHHVRTRLDEIKRIELQRLKDLTEKKRQLERELNTNSLDAGNVFDDDPLHHHLDRSNPHTFEIEDLKRLIAKTTDDLAEADKKRKEEFKMYEMEKEYQKQDRLNHTDSEVEREKIEKEYQMESEHKKHEKLHEPGHKAQLEEVWEQQDHMQQDFDPKTFFMLHDIDGNGLWDQEEVKALFIKELDKMYQEGAHEDDMRERVEEMERMRESVFEEMDKNRDGFIDYQEFLQQTNSKDFNNDQGWQGLDEQKVFNDDDLAEYIRQHHPDSVIVGQHQQQFYPGQELPHNVPQQLPGGNEIPYPQQGQINQQQYQQVPQVHNQPPQMQQVPQHQMNPNIQQHPQVHSQPPQMQQIPQQQINHNNQQQPPQVYNQPPQMQQQVPQQQAPQIQQASNQAPQQPTPQVHNQPK